MVEKNEGELLFKRGRRPRESSQEAFSSENRLTTFSCAKEIPRFPYSDVGLTIASTKSLEIWLAR